VRVASGDPLAEMLIELGVPYAPEVGETFEDASTWVFEFPVKGPENSVTKGDETAIEQLEYWKMLKTYWTEHNPSQTIYVKDDEWGEVGEWVYNNFDLITGVSFLPYDGGVYELAPYEEITEERFKELEAAMPSIDWDNLSDFEQVDKTTGSREYACKGGQCEL
jgi:ribonucleoside-diphosphate reductase alpha chain